MLRLGQSEQHSSLFLTEYCGLELGAIGGLERLPDVLSARVAVDLLADIFNGPDASGLGSELSTRMDCTHRLGCEASQLVQEQLCSL